MRPDNTRVWRKNGRKARRGVPTGRKATHAVETTYGHRQRERDRLADIARMVAEWKATHEPEAAAA